MFLTKDQANITTILKYLIPIYVNKIDLFKENIKDYTFSSEKNLKTALL